jgi:hypothetical protein
MNHLKGLKESAFFRSLLGAFVAAAHLDAAIEALCREYRLARKSSDTD